MEYRIYFVALLLSLVGLSVGKGGWSSWSEWSGFGKGLCSGNQRVKIRTCTNPLPDLSTGDYCEGENAVVEQGPVDGGLSEWSQWSTCELPCGGSIVNRTRLCNNPPPQNGGAYCTGQQVETKLECVTPCPEGRTDGGWSPWSAWTPCPKTCSRVGGGAVIQRYRQCNMPLPLFGGSQCQGNSTEKIVACFDGCPINGGFSQWSAFSPCSKTCGSGLKSRSRVCNNPEPRGISAKNCTGIFKEIRHCKDTICQGAVDGHWSNWSGWSSCSEKLYCNFGSSTRKRSCTNPSPSKGGDECQGLEEESVVCPTKNCRNYRPKAPSSLPVAKGDYIHRECKAAMKYIATGASGKTVPSKVFQHLKDNNKFKDGYFSTREEEHGKITKYCFEPFPALTIKEAADLVPSYRRTEEVPKYTKPSDENQPILGFSIRVANDGSNKLKGFDFGINKASVYTPRNKLKLEDTMFTYYSTGSKFGFLAKGQFRLFDPYVFDCVIFRNETYNETHLTGQTEKLKLVGLLDALKLPDGKNGAVGNVISAIRNLGIWDLEFTPVKLGYDFKQFKPTFRLTATNVVNGIPLHFELIAVTTGLQRKVAIGYAFDGASFGAVVEKMAGASSAGKAVANFLNTIGLQVEVGVVWCPSFLGAVVVSKYTRFTKEPLKDYFKYEVPKGLTAIGQVSIPKDCKDSSFCKICKKILGPKAKFRLGGTIKKGFYKVTAGFYKIKITGNYYFSKMELFAEVNTTAKKRVVGFKVQVEIPINQGEVVVDGMVQERKIKLGGEIKHTIGSSDIGGKLYMKGMWYHAFGLSWLNMGNILLGMTITIGSPIPVTGFQFGGQLEFGKNCLYSADFANEGHCLRVQVYFGYGKPTYFYGRISALTIGKLVRMCGGTTALPRPVAEAGFPEGLMVQYNPTEKDIDLRSSGGPFIYYGFWMRGVLNLFSYKIKVEIKYSAREILIDGEPDPINLGGHLVVSRNATHRDVGPKLYFHFKTPKDAWVKIPFFRMYFEGYLKVLGIETSAYVNITMQAMEIFVYGRVWNLIYAELYIAANYDYLKIQDANFYIRVLVDLRGLTDAIKKAQQAVDKAFKYAQKRLNDAVEHVKDAKRKCKEKLKIKCSNCYSLKCKQATENCKGFLDKAGKWIGGVLNKAGQWIVGVGKKIGKGLAKVGKAIKNFFRGWRRRKRSLLTQEDFEIHIRDRRFISKLICEGIVGGGCKGISHLCYGTCKAVDFIGQGLCHTLDIAVGALRLAEKTLGWVNAAIKFLLEIFLVHGIRFELGLGQKFNGFMVAAEIDLTIFGKRMYFGFTFDLNNPARSILSAKDGALYKYKAGVRQLRTGPTFNPYDQPNPFADFDLAGTFSIEALASGTENRLGACIAAPNADKYAKLILKACNETDRTQRWTYTLKGSLINLHSKKCLSMPSHSDGQVYQQECTKDPTLQTHECDVATRTLKLRRTKYCISAAVGTKENGPGALAQHGSLKCIHILPNNRLVLKSGCKRNDIIFQLDRNGKLIHTPSNRCVRPVNGNPSAGASLELIEQKYGCDEFAFTRLGSIQHVKSRLCLQTVKKEMIPADNTEVILGHRCEHTHVKNIPGALADPQMTFTFVPFDNQLRMKECTSFIDGKNEQRFSIMYEELQSVCSKFSKDLALDKIASQSSISRNGFPSRAVDGNYNYIWNQGSCTLTKEELDPWWRVDLGREHIVTDVTVINRYDDYGDKLENFQIHVGQNLIVRRNPTCHDRVRSAGRGEAVRLQCDPPIPGQFVGIQMYGKGALSVCEVIVASRLGAFVDYCQIENGGCDQICNNKCGREVQCSCLPGYKLAYDRKTCIDINECLVNNGGCATNQKTHCVNYPGSFVCRCSQGYILKDNSLTECVDLNECGIQNGGCEQMCNNKVGGYLCTCRKGYQRKKNDPYGCENINECLTNNGDCDHNCHDIDGGHYCSCKPGFRLMNDRKACEELYCPVLEKPHYGVVTPSTCITRFENIPIGSVCDYKCSKGYEIKSRVNQNYLSCRIDGTWDQDTPSCHPVKCPLLTRPRNGGLIPARCHSDSHGYSEYGQRCVAYCKHGYRLRGPGTKYCQSDKTWTSGQSMVECIKVVEPPYLNCPNDVDLVLPSHQKYTQMGSSWQPPQTNVNSSLIQVEPKNIGPTYKLFSGKILIMYRAILETGQQVACSYMVNVKDNTPPQMKNCPSDIKRTSGNDREIITWTEPTFTDNVQVRDVIKPHRKSGTVWENGESVRLQYIATDTSGNDVVCSFIVSFKSEVCPILKGDDVTQVQVFAPRRRYSVSCIGQRTFFGNHGTQGSVVHCKNGDYYIDQENMGSKTPECVGYTDSTATSSCPEGSQKFSYEDWFGFKTYYCARCPTGKFFNSTTQTCVECPIGTYQDEQGKIYCESCPRDHSTEDEGTKKSEGCLELCKPGYFSASGFDSQNEPCQTCPAGTYSYLSGTKQCLSCPDKSTTKTTGATSSDECLVALRITRVTPSNKVTVNSGSNVVLECFYEGVPTPESSWAKIGGSFPSNVATENLTDLDFNTIGVRITMFNLHSNDSGTYRCILQNSQSRVQSDIQVTVKSN